MNIILYVGVCRYALIVGYIEHHSLTDGCSVCYFWCVWVLSLIETYCAKHDCWDPTYRHRFQKDSFLVLKKKKKLTCIPQMLIKRQLGVWCLQRWQSQGTSEHSHSPSSPQRLPPLADASAFALHAILRIHGSENKPRVKQNQYKSPSQNTYDQIQGKRSCVANTVSMLQPAVRSEPRRWESRVQDTGPWETS